MLKKHKKWTFYFLLALLLVSTFIISPQLRKYKFDKFEQQYLTAYIAILDSCQIDNIYDTLLTQQNEDYMKKMESALQEMNSLNPSSRFINLSTANLKYDQLKLYMDTLKDTESSNDVTIGKIKPLIVKAKSIADLTLKERIK